MPDHRHDRRRFMTVTGAALAGFAGAPSLAASALSPRDATQVGVTDGRDPELIVVNAKVYTMDPQAPRAEAFAVTNGRFTAVGTTSDIKGLAGKTHADLRRQAA